MEKITFLRIEAHPFFIESKTVWNFTGTLQEQKTHIEREVGFVFDPLTGNHIVAVDISNKVLCKFVDESIQVDKLSEQVSYNVEISKYKESYAINKAYIASLLFKEIG